MILMNQNDFSTRIASLSATATSATCGTKTPVTIELEIHAGNSRSTRWLLRDLEGKWLMESMTPGLISAHCDGRMHVAVGAAINVHDLYTNNRDDDEP